MKGSQLQEYDQWLAEHLDELVAQYPGMGQLRKANALAEAVERGLRP